MAMGRLLWPKLSPHLNKRGFVISKCFNILPIPLTGRWFCSSLQDGRKFERAPDSETSSNKDVGQKGIPWYSFGALLTCLKQRITGNMLSMAKPSGEDSVPTQEYSSADATATKVVSLQNVVANKNCIPPSIKEESSVSQVGSQDPFQSVAGTETSGKRESTSVNKETLDNNSLLGSQFAQEKVLRLRSIQAQIMGRPQEPSSEDVSLGFLTEQVSDLQPEKVHSVLKIPSQNEQKYHQNKLSNFFKNPDPDKEVKLPLISEVLNNSKYTMSTGESCIDGGDQHGLLRKMLSDPVQKIKSISKKNANNRFSGAFQNLDFLASSKGENHEQKNQDVAAIRERKSTLSFDSSIKNSFDSLNLPTGNCTDTDANSWNPNVGEGKCASKGDAENIKSSSFCATEEQEFKGETLVMQNQTLCSKATLAATTSNTKLTKKSLGALSVGEHFPNKVMLRFVNGTYAMKDIVEVFSEFGAVLDVEEVPSFEGCIYKDALVTFETNSAVKKALKNAVVMVKNHYVVVEATSQGEMVETICIPDIVGDHDVPIALVKEPTQTVKIHPLEHNISSNQIKEALRFCRSHISKFILGSTKTAAFVEFETEDGKERALAAHSISISNGKQLFISRIDIPRTTVARISNLSVSAQRDLRKLCVPYGEIKKLFYRGKGISDVWFQLSEWPNMLTILNSLNGKEIDGMKWVVRPATTVIPPEILRVLWDDPREKRYVKSVIQNLVREIEQPLDATRSYTLLTELLL